MNGSCFGGDFMIWIKTTGPIKEVLYIRGSEALQREDAASAPLKAPLLVQRTHRLSAQGPHGLCNNTSVGGLTGSQMLVKPGRDLIKRLAAALINCSFSGNPTSGYAYTPLQHSPSPLGRTGFPPAGNSREFLRALLK